MIIHQPQLIFSDSNTEYQAAISESCLPPLLRFAVPNEHASLLTESSEAALLALLIPAMFCGEAITIEGEVDSQLLDAVCHHLQPLLVRLMPFLVPVTINYRQTSQHQRQPGNGVATGFSGGVDSWATLNKHLSPKQPHHPKLTHLLFNNVGSHGSRGYELFMRRFRQLEPIAATIGLPFVPVDSNVDSFYKPALGRQVGFEQTHTLRNIAVGYVLSSGLKSWIYSSTYHYRETRVSPNKAIGILDPLIVPMLSSNVLQTINCGAEWTRVDKTVAIAKLPSVQQSLDVCVKGAVGENCSVCWKCMRTQITLDLAGQLEAFSAVFNLNRYRQHHAGYLRRILHSDAPLEREILEKIEATGYPIPLLYRLTGPAIRLLKHRIAALRY